MNKLLQQVLGEADLQTTTVYDETPGAFDKLVQLAHRGYVDERVNGFKHPDTGAMVGPVSRDQAEAAWQRIEPRFRAMLAEVEPGSEISRKQGLHQGRDVYNYRNLNAQ